MFPARVIRGVPTARDQIELVDGGFAHNSPIEAPVMWGATHIFLLEANAPRHRERNNFAQNVSASLQHLHQQAQLLDTRMRQEVTVFSLQPEPPHICVLDFADNLIRASIDRGDREARVLRADGIPRFRKQPGTPRFTSVAAEP